MIAHSLLFSFFFFNDTATTEIYTLSLHDALPIWRFLKDSVRALAKEGSLYQAGKNNACQLHGLWRANQKSDRKSTRLNSSHQIISYAVFCLKKKKRKKK